MSNEVSRRLVIIGAGGHGRAVAEAAQMMGKWGRIAFLDDALPRHAEVRPGQPVLGRTDELSDVTTVEDRYFVAIGNQSVRRRLLDALSSSKVGLATVIHPRAWVSTEAQVGEGTAIMAGAVVGCQAQVGRGVIVNANATVDHDVVLEDFAHVGVGVQLAGGVIVRTGAWLQAGTCAGYNVVVPEQTVVAPGTALREV